VDNTQRIIIIIEDKILIAKDPATIWGLLTDISRWSRWTRLIKQVAVYGPVKSGTEFKCLVGKWDLDGAIVEVDPEKRFVFDARSIGLHLRFSWEITGQGDESRVSSEIDVSGWMPFIFKKRARQELEDTLFRWLYALKTTLERGEKAAMFSEQSITKPKKRRALSGPLSFLFKKKDSEE
jgi:hypothetical protein